MIKSIFINKVHAHDAKQKYHYQNLSFKTDSEMGFPGLKL